MNYEIRKFDVTNYKEFTIWQHATNKKWEVRPDGCSIGSDVLILVDEKRIAYFEHMGGKYIVEIPKNKKFLISKTENFENLGIQKVVYISFCDADIVNYDIIGI